MSLNSPSKWNGRGKPNVFYTGAIFVPPCFYEAHVRPNRHMLRTSNKRSIKRKYTKCNIKYLASPKSTPPSMNQNIINYIKMFSISINIKKKSFRFCKNVWHHNKIMNANEYVCDVRILTITWLATEMSGKNWKKLILFRFWCTFEYSKNL